MSLLDSLMLWLAAVVVAWLLIAHATDIPGAMDLYHAANAQFTTLNQQVTPDYAEQTASGIGGVISDFRQSFEALIADALNAAG